MSHSIDESKIISTVFVEKEKWDKLQEEVKRLKDALSVYADKGNWNYGIPNVKEKIFIDPNHMDGWEIANNALRGGK